MSKCKVCGEETFFIRNVEGGDYYRIVCTNCDTLCGHLHRNHIPTIELTSDEIESEKQYFGL